MKVVSPETKTSLLVNKNYQAFAFCTARAAIRHLMANRVKGLDADGNAVSWTGVDLELRDYFLGMPSDFGLDFMVRLAEKMLPNIEATERPAIYTCYSAFLYERGETDRAFLALSEAQDLEPEYPLAGLLSRIYEAGWSAELFGKMRSELHPKVILGIKNHASNLI